MLRKNLATNRVYGRFPDGLDENDTRARLRDPHHFIDRTFRGNTRREPEFGNHHVEDTVPERQPVHLSRLDMHPFEHPIRPQPVLGAIQKGGIVFDP